LSTWGLALLDETTGQPDRATAGYRHLVTRCRETEERHYCVPALQFAVARFAGDGAVADLGAATAVLADAATVTGQPEPRAAFVLTAREAQVLRLVGDGLTSREIGRQLFLSVRTVEMHVRNGVQKLGCRTRAEAVRRLAATDPGGTG